ncbi:MAG TPA: serine/threonine-protein phosphatase, partial [Chloroflexi bacterium]|nr:serine/threonine-protein phosphatase [Chloroflexota bacterium]
MYLSVAVSKINRWAVRESGDTLEMIERPHGGLSFVLADGQSSGRGAKAISAQVVRKIITDLAEGVRDGAAARAANDLLYAQRHGRVSAELVILSVELDSGLLIITRCGQTPVFVRLPGEEVEFLESE